MTRFRPCVSCVTHRASGAPLPDAPAPVGVRVLRSAGEIADVSVYHGVSYCDAVRRAGEGETLRVLPGSIQVCRWAEVVLGLKAPSGRFEQSLVPRLAFPVAGLLLAPLDRVPGEPEAVVVQARPEVLRGMISLCGPGGRSGLLPALWEDRAERLDRSALPVLTGGRATLRRGLIGAVNRTLASLARFAGWQALTRWLFRSRAVTAGFDALISHTIADMSVCRNSTVVPLLTGRVNVSFFCTGGITWGRGHPDHLTSGWPWPQFQVACRASLASRRRH